MELESETRVDKTPFIFGRMAEFENFTNRHHERKQLEQNFQALINTMIISPRRWGKSSLVKRVSNDVMTKHKRLKVCHIDLYNVRSEAEFYAQLATMVIKSTSSRWEEWLKLSREFLSHLRPQISFSGDMHEDISFDVEWDKVKQSPDEIIDLAEKIAVAKDIKIVVCIDEFQSIGDFKDSLAFQRKLRSHWQKHQHVCYCLYGSKRHMLLDIFTNASMPFYRFGDIILLDKISNEQWGKFICERFLTTGKTISMKQACYLANMVDNHSYYVQQLAQQVWLRTAKVCDFEIIDTAMENVKNQLSLLFINMVDTLTARQLSFLKAVLDGVTKYSSMDILKEYSLGTSANVKRIKDALQEKEIIDISGNNIQILDPLFKYWLVHDYY